MKMKKIASSVADDAGCGSAFAARGDLIFFFGFVYDEIKKDCA